MENIYLFIIFMINIKKLNHFVFKMNDNSRYKLISFNFLLSNHYWDD